MMRLQSIRYTLAFSLFAFSGLGFAQVPPAPAQDPQSVPQQPPPATGGAWTPIGNSGAPAGNSATDGQSGPQAMPPQTAPQNSGPVPAQITLKPGTYVTVRINQPLSSDKNQAGDAFSATLVRPIVADGWVIAERGQTLGGKVTEAKKAGRVSGVSRLAVSLTDIPLADGQQVPVQSSLISRQGPTSQGRDAAAIAGTTAFGAAVGAAAAWGPGAAMGAGAGFVAATVGVLLTRGHPTIIYPESILTFRIEQPVTISTANAPQTFRPVEPADYQMAPAPRMMTRGPGYPPPPVVPAYYYGGYYPYYGYPYYWGPAFYGGFYFGPRGFIGQRW
jgi:hypothetical protein